LWYNRYQEIAKVISHRLLSGSEPLENHRINVEGNTQSLKWVRVLFLPQMVKEKERKGDIETNT
jgi:hypothetical protein